MEPFKYLSNIEGYTKLIESDIKITASMEKIDGNITSLKQANAEHRLRRIKSLKLPKLLRTYYLRCGTIRHPYTWIISFVFGIILDYVRLFYLKTRKLVGQPKDIISISDILYTRNPIQSAILNLNPGGEVKVVPGENLISTQITTVNDFTLKGSGKSSVLKMADSTNLDSIINVGSDSHVTIKEILFDTNGTNQSGGNNRAIKADGANHLTIDKCVFAGPARAEAALSIANTDDVEIKGCFQNDYGWAFLFLDGTTRFSVHDNMIVNTDNTDCVAVRTDCEKGSISNNIIHDAANGGITFLDTPQLGQAPRYITISDNIITNTFGDCILIEQGTLISVTGNIIQGNHSSGGDTGISVGGEQCSVVGNIVNGKAGNGIAVFHNGKVGQSKFYKIISSNVVANCGTALGAGESRNGIWLDDAQRCIISNNLTIDSQGSPTQAYGIRATGTSGRNIITGNGAVGNVTSQFSFAGSGGADFENGNVDWSLNEMRVGAFKQFGDIDADTFGGHKTYLYFFQENVAASQVGVNLGINGTATGTSYQMDRAGSVIGITIRSVGNRTAGTLTVEPYIEGVATGLQAVLNGSSSQFAVSTTQAKDSSNSTFSTNQRIFCKITTDGSWLPTTADIQVGVIIEF